MSYPQMQTLPPEPKTCTKLCADAYAEGHEEGFTAGLRHWRRYERIVVASWGSTPGRAMDDPTQRGPHLGLALAGEAGEVIELIKKAHREADDCRVVDVRKLLDEVGDVLWAITSIAAWAGHSLDDVRALNMIKMEQRHPQLVKEVR